LIPGASRPPPRRRRFQFPRLRNGPPLHEATATDFSPSRPLPRRNSELINVPGHRSTLRVYTLGVRMVFDPEVTHRTTLAHRVPIAAFCRRDTSITSMYTNEIPCENVGYKYHARVRVGILGGPRCYSSPCTAKCANSSSPRNLLAIASILFFGFASCFLGHWPTRSHAFHALSWTHGADRTFIVSFPCKPTLGLLLIRGRRLRAK